MAPTGSSRKRKACQSCIRAKARCAPAEAGGEACARCRRLGKECIAEVVVRRVVKPRSRVRQLEQRVESLIGMLASGNGVGNLSSAGAGEEVVTLTPESESLDTTPTSAAVAASSNTSGPLPMQDESPEFCDGNMLPPHYDAWDPITAGVIDEQHAALLLHEFKAMFIFSFPFVIVTDDMPTLRREHPFLFHAILAVTSYASPRIQIQLADKLRRQVAQLIEFSQKGLDLLQGLMVYAAWYHAFYHPATQQLGMIIQLCVAMVQDLDLTRNVKGKRSLEDCRAYLGTYFLAVSYAQAWRKRPTLSHTWFTSQCCERLAISDLPTDTLITPLVQLSELIARVNDFFSYDDLDNAQFKGVVMLEMSTNNFHAELERIKSSTTGNELTKQNTSLQLRCLLADVWINECSLHHSMWPGAISEFHSNLPPLRSAMLYRAMASCKAYVEILNDSPRSLLYQLPLSTWAAWFYVMAVTCKLVFLEETDTPDDTGVDGIQGEISNLFVDPPPPTRRNLHSQDGFIWDPVRVAHDSQIEDVFLRFRRHLVLALPLDDPPWLRNKMDRDSLYAIACMHQMLTQGFRKRLHELQSSAPASDTHIASITPTDSLPAIISKIDGTSMLRRSSSNAAATSTTAGTATAANTTTTTTTPSSSHGRPAPIAGFMHFDTINFDGITLPPSLATQFHSMDDWIWNTALDEFTLPSL